MIARRQRKIWISSMLLHAGMARLFLDEQVADLLADPACRFMSRTYVTRAAARSQNIVTDFDYS